MSHATNWADNYINNKRDLDAAIKLIKPGQRVFIGSASGEPQFLVHGLTEASGTFTDIEIVRLLSLESSPLTLIANKTQEQRFTIRSFYNGSAQTQRISRNQRFVTPINLSAVARLFKSKLLPIQVALIQVSPPDDFGWMSLGVSVDITQAAALSADLVIAQVNANMPRVLGRSFIHVNEIDIFVEHNEEILTIGEDPNSTEADTIGANIHRLIEDGSTMQISLGATPQATLKGLGERNDLGIHTEHLTDGIMHLVSTGVVTNRKKGFNEGKLVASGAVGTRNLYDFLHDNPAIEFHPSEYVNNPVVISQHHKMVSLNVAMSIDLTGQVVADALPHNNYSGVTGMLDFARGAAMSEGGKSIFMLTSTAMHGKQSRIVPMLCDTAIVVPRGDVQYVATEYGAVNLFGKNLQERAMALISIAHPDFRDELFFNAKKIGLLGAERTITESLHGVYPSHLEEVIEIDNEPITLRPVKPTDERMIQEHFYNLNEDDVVARFFHEKTRFVREDIEGTLQIDYVHELVFVAVVGELGFDKVVAIAEYLLDPQKQLAEIAFSVSRDYQKKGLGKLLLNKMTASAIKNGIKGFFAYTSINNRAMINLFRQLPFNIHSESEDGMLILSCHFRDKKK